MGELLYSVLEFFGYKHPLHPVITHLVIGPVIAALIFQLVALAFKKPIFFKTARHMTVLGLIFWFPTVIVGVIDWIEKFGAASNLAPILFKSIGAGLVFLSLLSAIILFKKVKENAPILLILYLFSAGAVGMIGYFGGDLVYQEKEAPKTSQMETTLDAEGFKTLSTEGYTLKWKIEGQNISVKTSYKTTGWVGVGFGKSGMMKDSHIVLGYVGKDGKAVVEDHYGNANQAHKSKVALSRPDTLIERGADYKDEVTTIWFTMPLKTADPQDPVLTPGEEYSVILARATTAKDTKSYHGGGKEGGRLTIKVKL